MNNPQLLELEKRIGRFNIFEVLGLTRAEIKHSNFLAWLLDPTQSHGAGDNFLKAVLMDISSESSAPGFPRPLDFYGASLEDARVWRERLRVDILVYCENPSCIVAIENKIGATEHKDQLKIYADKIQDRYRDVPTVFVYLTPEGDQPTDSRWIAYSYSNLQEALGRARATTDWTPDNQASVLLDDYLRILESEVLEQPDKEIEQLCRIIYSQHPQAVRLLAAHLPDASPILAKARELVEQRSDTFELLSMRSGVFFIPHVIKKSLPTIDEGSEWLLWRYDVGTHSRDKLRLMTTAERCQDPTKADLRRAVLDALISQLDGYFVYPSHKAKTNTNQIRLRTKFPYEFGDPDKIDIDEAEPKIRESLDEIANILPRMVDVITRAQVSR